MKRKLIRKIYTFILAFAMVITVAPVTALAEEDTTEESVQDNTEETTNRLTNVDAENKEVEEESDINSESEQEYIENSWRYSDGELIVPSNYADTSFPNAWEKVNGQYYNDIGEVIPGVRKRGVDVSEHQGKIDWEKVKADGVDYAIIRVGWSANDNRREDYEFQYNVAECERLGIPYGVYVYSYITTTAGANNAADFVLNLLKGHTLSYPVYLDLEDDDIIAADNASISKVFLDKISNAGYRVGIYANLNWWNNYLTSPVFDNSSWSKWVAQYYHSCSYAGVYDMWQCTSQGSVDGISGKVDLNMDFRIGETGPTLVVKDDGTYCYEDGKQLFGEQKIDGKWYYFDENDNGRMQTGWYVLAKKTVYYGADGAMVYGDQKIDGKWYMFETPSGAMVTGWYDNKEKGKKVYYGEDGAIVYGDQKIDGKWYMFETPSGAMVTGWYDNKEKGKKVYYGEDGAIVYGEKKINGKWYCFRNPTGEMIIGWHDLINKTVYYGEDGAMVYGEQIIDGVKYYFEEVTGALVRK